MAAFDVKVLYSNLAFPRTEPYKYDHYVGLARLTIVLWLWRVREGFFPQKREKRFYVAKIALLKLKLNILVFK
jgi:hypothetical protein